MSYCRFNFDATDGDPDRSEVYCYLDCDGAYVVRRYDRRVAKYLPTVASPPVATVPRRR